MDSFYETRKSQAKVLLVGAGVSHTQMSFGFNVATVGLLGLRKNRQAKEFTYGLSSALDVDGHSGSLGVGIAYSDWFYISDEAFEALKFDSIVGKGVSADIHIKGTTLLYGKSDIEIGLINRQGNYKKIVDVRDIQVNGLQVAGTSVRGKLVRGPETLNRQRQGLSNF